MPFFSWRARGRLVLLVVFLLTFASCDFLDPTEVENPQTTLEELAGAPDPTTRLLPGLQAQFGRALNAVVVATETASDNYAIRGTGLGGDDLDYAARIAPNTAIINSRGTIGVYFNLQELRALADFILEDIVPDDSLVTDDQLAEIHYYRGMAFLMLGEHFVALPLEADGEPVPAGQLLQEAVADFDRSLELSSTGAFAVPNFAALARAHRALGNTDQVAPFAQEALAQGGTDFLFLYLFDDNVLDNLPGNFLVDRSLQEMQPLPRLDFLDPKYTEDTSGIPVAKAEELYLLLAEASMAAGDFASGRGFLIEAVNAASARTATATFDDPDQRQDNELNVRPRSAEIVVRADAESPFRAGLVLERPGVVVTPEISATSITADSLGNVDVSDEVQLVRLLYTLRQEILFLEGRRLHDLGLRFPMMLLEIETNPNIDEGDFGTSVFVPAYLPGTARENTIDLYEPLVLYDDDDLDASLIEEEVTILVDMNRVLATERGLVVENPLLPQP